MIDKITLHILFSDEDQVISKSGGAVMINGKDKLKSIDQLWKQARKDIMEVIKKNEMSGVRNND